MRSQQIQKLIDAVEREYGPVELYGADPSEEHGTCFTIAGVAAMFSVHTQDGALPDGVYDVQIEDIPGGEYMFTDVVSLTAFLEHVAKVCGQEDKWPGIDRNGT